jgi:RNA polymerase sigma-70 factor (sigma-E family)
MPEDDISQFAFSQFAARAWPGLVRTALLLTGDHAQAEDLAQNTLVRVHRHWRAVNRAERPDAYVHRILVNQHRSAWRRHRGRELLVASVPERPGPDGPDERLDRDARLESALAGLPPRMRAVLVLRFYSDLSEHQTAEALGCSTGTVKSQTSRGLTRLRQALAGTDRPADIPTRRAR